MPNAHLFFSTDVAKRGGAGRERVRRIGQTQVVLVYEYRVGGTFNIYLINKNKAIPGIVTELYIGSAVDQEPGM